MNLLLLILLSFFTITALIQIIYLVIFLIGLKKASLSPQPDPEPVSIVISAHDEEQNLQELVPVLLSQDYPVFEVVIVNDRSNDSTYDFLLDYTKRDPRLKMVNVKDTPAHVNGKKYALTLGIRAAMHDRILLTDADCRPHSNQWIRTMSRQFTPGTSFILGFSPYQEEPGFLNHFIRFESLVTALQYLSFALLGNPYMGVGRNLSYRKSVFLEKKGFNNFLHVMGGDDDLFVNQHATGANTRVTFEADATVVSIPEKKWVDFFYQKVRHLSVGKKYKGSHKFLLAVFKLSWVFSLFAALAGLIVFGGELYVMLAIASAWILRWILLGAGIHTLVKRAGVKFNFWILPLLDIVYPFYYISTGLVALFTKKVRWKT